MNDIYKQLRHFVSRTRSYVLGRYFPKYWANQLFKRRHGRNLNWEKPATYNEIIHCEKLLLDTSAWSVLADKYRVREYIQSKGLADILVPLYGVWDKVEDIDFALLPNKFILKLNNGCGANLIVRDKGTLDIDSVKKTLNAWMKMSFGYRSVEPHYLQIKPLIIAEQLLESDSDDANQSISLLDYKWFCFKGYVSYVELVSDRTDQDFKVSIYDANWNEFPHFVSPNNRSDKQFPKPANLKRMIDVCNILSADLPQVRVDLYEVNDKIYFGELTLSSAAGCSTTKTDKFDKLLGDIYFTHNSEVNNGKR